jgi:nitroreductase
MDAITAIQQRSSVRHYRPEPVSRTIIEQLLQCAVRAPNHKLTEPWRFTVFGSGARARFAELRARHRLKRYDNPAAPEALAAAAKIRRETIDTPAFVVISSKVDQDEITREEDYAASMMAAENLMIAAESLGLGSYLKTGGIMRDPELLQLARVAEGFRVVAIISLGYPADRETPRRRKPVSGLTEWVE